LQQQQQHFGAKVESSSSQGFASAALDMRRARRLMEAPQSPSEEFLKALQKGKNLGSRSIETVVEKLRGKSSSGGHLTPPDEIRNFYCSPVKDEKNHSEDSLHDKKGEPKDAKKVVLCSYWSKFFNPSEPAARIEEKHLSEMKQMVANHVDLSWRKSQKWKNSLEEKKVEHQFVQSWKRRVDPQAGQDKVKYGMKKLIGTLPADVARGLRFMMDISPMNFSICADDEAVDMYDSQGLGALKNALLRILLEKDRDSLHHAAASGDDEKQWKQWMATRADIICLLSSIHEQEKDTAAFVDRRRRYEANPMPRLLDKNYRNCGPFFFLPSCDGNKASQLHGWSSQVCQPFRHSQQGMSSSG